MGKAVEFTKINKYFPGVHVLKDISFSVEEGEVHALLGENGAGKSTLLNILHGVDPEYEGEVMLHGKKVTGSWYSTKALKSGIGLIPEDRKTQGFLTLSSNIDNIAISSLEKYMKGAFMDPKKQRANAERYFKEMDIHPNDPDYLTKNLSGGNQQKVILSRWMSTDADIIIFDEPTKGVDVAAKAEIYRLMEDMLEEGKSIIVVSSELPEVMGLSDRIIIMCEGHINKEFNRDEFKSSDEMLDYAIGGN